MTSTDRETARGRRARGKPRVGFDSLESRLALSGASSGLAPGPIADAGTSAAEVAPGIPATFGRSATAVTVSFDGPLDPFSVGNDDFRLEAVGGDASAARSIPLTESPDPSDPTGSRIVLALARPLDSGHYRLVLLAGSQLELKGGSPLAGVGPAIDVSDFSVAATGPDLFAAVDLGVPTSTVAAVSDRLDPGAGVAAGKLYKLELPAGHFWRLGLEVPAGVGGGTFAPSLSLYDSGGKLVATDSLGPDGLPGDPYLFAGLGAGTYYVAVAGSGQAGGSFQLDDVADPADRPTAVIGLKLDDADVESPAPTGLTVRFSGPIRTGDLADPARPVAVLVDAQGQAWPLTATDYDEATASLSFAFDRALPAGHYTVEIADPGTLADLAGLTPVAPGEPSGVLGAFEIAASPRAAADLGVLLPGVATVGPGNPATIPAGGSIAEHFTIVQPGSYSIQVPGGGIVAELFTDRAGPSIDSPVATTPDGNVLHTYLGVGTYSIVLLNPGTTPATASAEVGKATLGASLIESGVGQGPALGLRSASPTPAAGPAAAAGPALPPATSAASGQSAAPPAVVAASSGPAAPSASFFVVGNAVGRPDSRPEPPGPAGSGFSASAPSGPSAVTSGAMPSPGASPRAVRTGPDAEVPAPGVEVARTTPSPVAVASIGDDPTIARDRRTLADAAWLDEMVAWTVDRFTSTPDGPEPEPTAVVAAVPASEGTRTGEEAPVRLASFVSPLGIGILAVAFQRYRKSRRERRNPAGLVGQAATPRGGLRGPHHRPRPAVARAR